MTAFMLACYLNAVVQGSIHFKSINDCVYYKKRLNNQELIMGTETKLYSCVCKLIPSVNTDKVKVY